MKNLITETKLQLLILVVISVFLGCNRESEDVDVQHFIGKKYSHLLFATEKECIKAQTDPEFFINCAQQLEFMDEKYATIMLTDIMNRAGYSVSGKTITLRADYGPELYEDIVFEIIDEKTLKRMDNGSIWRLQIGDSIWGASN